MNMNNGRQQPKSAKLLYEQFKRKGHASGEEVALHPDLLRCHYATNPSIPFELEGRTMMAVRLVNRETYESACVFVYRDGDVWSRLDPSPVFQLEDPFVTIIQGELIFGGVRSWKTGNDQWRWATEFYRGNKLDPAEAFFHRPGTNEGYPSG